jgi:hypothetical protein
MDLSDICWRTGRQPTIKKLVCPLNGIGGFKTPGAIRRAVPLE